MQSSRTSMDPRESPRLAATIATSSNATMVLDQVHRASLNSTRLEFPDVQAWIVGFKVVQKYPSRFVYRACPGKAFYGRCNKSLEAGDVCGHGFSESDAALAFRFKLLICDQSGPIWATVFDAVEGPLGINASKFWKLSERAQEEWVQGWINHHPLCQFVIQVDNRGDVTVKSLKVLRWRNGFMPVPQSPIKPKKLAFDAGSSSSVGRKGSTKQSPIVIDEEEYEALLTAVRNLKS